jgi:uncharacterized Fe-S cluster-containing protein
MTREEILRMAESVGFYLVDFVDDDKSVIEQIQADNSESLYSFAALVAAAEREACAKFLIDLYESDGGYHPAEEFAKNAAAVIRARGV